MSRFLQKKQHQCLCPWSPGESRAICRVAIQLHGTQLFHVVHGAVIPAQTSSVLCSLLSALLQLIIFPVDWKKLLSRNEPRSSCAIFTCNTYSQNSMHPATISLAYGQAELSPPSPLTSVFSAHWYPVSRPILPGAVLRQRVNGGPPCRQPAPFPSLLAPYQGAKHDARREPAPSCKIALGW